ncbi:MAG TPA: LuxR C-terminal-related transcriptional regulator [Solirubrobacteraceae bacterium]|nr:LuxR C-terminal-related transcriptional regulator [Solirubrobacteraceae bacterium]
MPTPISEQLPRLPGRDAAVSAIRDVLATARTAARGALITGAPGLGKSTLLHTAQTMAGDARVLQATGFPLEADVPFAGLHQLIGPLLPLDRSVPARQREVLESALFMGHSTAHGDLGVAAALLAVLGAAAEHDPVLILVDDAQWVDQPSLQALLFAFRRLADEAVALIAGARPLEADHPVRLAGLRPIELAPLDVAAAVEVAQAHAASRMTPSQLARVTQLAAGVPLALVQLAEMDYDLVALPGGTGPVTGLVERLFGRRVQQLSAPAAMVSLIVALDEPAELDAFVRAADALNAGAAAWEETERRGVLRLSEGHADFTHPLLREAVLQLAGAARRRRAHTALARAMSERGDSFRGAWHRAAGIVGADESAAAELERAAAGFRDRSGHRTAARALARAAQLSESVGERARRLLLAGDSACHAGDADWAAELAAEARADAPARAQRARAELLLGHADAWRGSMEMARRRYERVADEIDDVDPELAALALVDAAGVGIVAGDLAAADAHAFRAAEIDPQALTPAGRVKVVETLGFLHAVLGRTDAARPLLEEAAAWYERMPERFGAEYGAEALVWLGNYSRARSLLDDLAADARRMGAGLLLTQTLVLRAELGYRTGAWPAALADVHEAVELATDAGQSVHLAYALAGRAILHVVAGAEDAARRDAARAAEGARRHALRVVEESAAFALGALELAAGHPDQALVHLLPLDVAVASTGRGEPAVSLWPAELVEALIGADRHREAAQVLERLDGQAHQTGGDWARGIVDRYRGVLAADDRFDDHFARASAAHAASGMPFELARTRFLYGRRLRRAGRRVEARAQLRSASASFETLGAATWAQLAARELAGSGERLRRGPTADRDELTPQERQIASVIAGGASNRDAAARLFLSPKTIETHLTRIYRKLGVSSRSQLAVLVGTGELVVSAPSANDSD